MEDGLCLSSHKDMISECVSQSSLFHPTFTNREKYHSAAGGLGGIGVHVPLMKASTGCKSK